MNRFSPPLFLAGLLLCPTASYASLEIAQKNACTACHAVDRKLVGPSYQDIAKKYAAQRDVSALTVSIKKGGVGKWGPIPMPAQENLSEAEAAILATWILGLSK